MHVVHKRYLPLSDQFASSVTPLRWYLLVVEFCGPKEELSSFVKITNVTLTKQKVKFTRVKLKVRIVDCICVKTSVALLAPHNPVEFVTLGLRFNTSWIVWPKRKNTKPKIHFVSSLFYFYWQLVKHLLFLGRMATLEAVVYLILRCVGNIELQPHFSQETYGVIGVLHSVIALLRCSWRGLSWNCCCTDSGRWRCCAGLICKTYGLCEQRNNTVNMKLFKLKTTQK